MMLESERTSARPARRRGRRCAEVAALVLGAARAVAAQSVNGAATTNYLHGAVRAAGQRPERSSGPKAKVFHGGMNAQILDAEVAEIFRTHSPYEGDWQHGSVDGHVGVHAGPAAAAAATRGPATRLHHGGAKQHRHSGWYDCMYHGEAYTAAYFIERDVFENVSGVPEIFCAKVTNMESASFTVMPNKRRLGWKNDGTIKKSVDLFAFAITHLSWLERYMTQFGLNRRLRPWFVPHVLDRVKGYAWRGKAFHAPEVQKAADATVVLMPFFATSAANLGDAGHRAGKG